MKTTLKVQKIIILQNSLIATAVFILLMIWFALTSTLKPLYHSITLAFMTAVWVVLAPVFINTLKINFFNFECLETKSSNIFYSKMQIGKYLNSLECSLNDKQAIYYPLFQILTFGMCYKIFKYLNEIKDPNFTLIFICVMTLGFYLSVRSMLFTLCLIWSKHIKPFI